MPDAKISQGLAFFDCLFIKPFYLTNELLWMEHVSTKFLYKSKICNLRKTIWSVFVCVLVADYWPAAVIRKPPF